MVPISVSLLGECLSSFLPLSHASRLLSVFPSPVVNAHFALVLLCWSWDHVNLHASPLRMGFLFPVILQSSWISSLLLKARCFEGLCLQLSI